MRWEKRGMRVDGAPFAGPAAPRPRAHAPASPPAGLGLGPAASAGPSREVAVRASPARPGRALGRGSSSAGRPCAVATNVGRLVGGGSRAERPPAGRGLESPQLLVDVLDELELALQVVLDLRTAPRRGQPGWRGRRGPAAGDRPSATAPAPVRPPASTGGPGSASPPRQSRPARCRSCPAARTHAPCAWGAGRGESVWEARDGTRAPAGASALLTSGPARSAGLRATWAVARRASAAQSNPTSTCPARVV